MDKRDIPAMEGRDYIRRVCRNNNISIENLDIHRISKHIKYIQTKAISVILKRHISGLYFLMVEYKTRVSPMFTTQDEGILRFEELYFKPYRRVGHTLYYINDKHTRTYIKKRLSGLNIIVPFRVDDSASPIV